MYDLVDQAVQTLPPRDQFLLRAMRSWVFSRVMGRHPTPVLAPLFDKLGWGDALPAFDTVMETLDRGSTEVMAFGRPCHERVEEFEAVILALWRAMPEGSEMRANRILELLVDPGAVRQIAASMALVCNQMQPAREAPGRS